ncbi:hypothetical protein J7M28_06455 [bacterium]|nr:hypothetical protein [bacterium]
MSNRKELLGTIAKIISDYREGDIPPRAPELIEHWLQQFPASIQDDLLEACVHVFKKTYISLTSFRSFLTGLAVSDKLYPGCEPSDYWLEANLLDIQQGGNSQKEILEIFDEILQDEHGFGLADTGSGDGDFVYIDDCMGTGNRVKHDICSWLDQDTPRQITLKVVTPILYAGSWWIDEWIKQKATENGKTITIEKYYLDDSYLENRKGYRNNSDVLWPTEIPDDGCVRAYCDLLSERGYPHEVRARGNPGAAEIFRDDSQKILLEQAFLVRGCQIRRENPNLPEVARPLGYNKLHSLGFGSMFVMYRNCPNNCPLVFWVEQDEYPALFPRKTNTQTREGALFSPKTPARPTEESIPEDFPF